ncbi:MAG: hypothetical protein FWD15_02285 [Alphaproteobacteria bacterium]|nr:hypothetical protein [Alphaproteobacteria bacterium]
MKKILSYALIAVAVSGGGCSASVAAPKIVEISGVCERQIIPSRISREVEIDLDRAIASGLAMAKKAVAKIADVYEGADKKDVEGSVNVRVRDRKSGEEERNVEMPFAVSIPKIGEREIDDLDSFFERLWAGAPAKGEIVRTSQRLGVGEKEFEEEYKSCFAEALEDAKLRAALELGDADFTVVSVEQDESASMVSDESEGELNMRVVLRVKFSTP